MSSMSSPQSPHQNQQYELTLKQYSPFVTVAWNHNPTNKSGLAFARQVIRNICSNIKARFHQVWHRCFHKVWITNATLTQSALKELKKIEHIKVPQKENSGRKFKENSGTNLDVKNVLQDVRNTIGVFKKLGAESEAAIIEKQFKPVDEHWNLQQQEDSPIDKNIDGSNTASKDQDLDISQPKTVADEQPINPVIEQQINTLHQDEDSLIDRIAHGYDTPPQNHDFTATLDRHKAGAAQGNVHSILHLAYCLDEGLGCDVDKEKALQYYLKVLELDPNNTEAMFRVGESYDKSIGVDVDTIKAIHYYHKAVDLGSREAMYELAPYYYHGLEHEGQEVIKKDVEKAHALYIQAAKLGHHDAMLQAGYLFAKAGNFEQALGWYKQVYLIDKARFLAPPPDWTKSKPNLSPERLETFNSALELLGELFAKEGPNQDLQQAFAYYHEGAIRKHIPCMMEAAEYYDENRGVNKAELDKQFPNGYSNELYKEAADLGDSEAQNEWGYRLHFGENGVNQNHEEALKYYTLAAEQGHVTAMFNLASLYQNSEDPQIKDIAKAIEWYTKASEEGDEDAIIGLALIKH